MKLFVVFILSALCNNALGQAEQLNKLFTQYGYTWELNKQVPIASQNSKELLVPHYIESMGQLSVIKWKDIARVNISDNRGGTIFIDVYGKAAKYRKCKPGDAKASKYLDTLYCKIAKTDSVRLMFSSKIDSVKLAHSDTIRTELRKLFHQLNNSPVTENYSPRPLHKHLEYNITTKEISICRFAYELDKALLIAAEDLMNARKISISFVNEKNETVIFKISSFTLYIGKEGAVSTITNERAHFNDELVKLLQTARPGMFLIFDNFKVDTGKEGVRTIMGLSILVK